VRVLTVGNMYPPHHLGGYELIWRDAVRRLRDGGHAVRVLTTDYRRDDEGGSGDEDGSEDVHRELRWYWRDHRWRRLGPRGRLGIERENGATLERHLAEFGPDVVGWWAMGGMSLSMIERVRRLGIPAAGLICDEWLVYGPGVDGWLRMTRRPGLGRAAELITRIPARVDFDAVGPWLFLSELLRERSVAARPLHDTEVAHLGADRAIFTPKPPQPWGWRLLYAGRIDPRKGIDLAILALRHLPAEATLDVVGGGDTAHLRELRSLAAAEEVYGRVRFLPVESRETLREHYARADALLFPVRWDEPWGLVPLEAMAVGTPVIASGRGGSGEYLEDGANCLIFDPDGGAEALAARVMELAGDEELRARLRAGGEATSAEIPSDGFIAAAERTLSRAAESAAGRRG